MGAPRNQAARSTSRKGDTGGAMQTVKILNPAHGDGWTSIKRAQEYVDQGRAVWRKRPDGKLEIKFFKSHPLDAKVRATKPAPAYDGYDRRNTPLTVEEQTNVPIIWFPKRKIHQRRRSRRLTIPNDSTLSFPLNPTKDLAKLSR